MASQWRRKSHISDATWEAVNIKKNLYKQTRALKRTYLHTVLKACFEGWHAMRPGSQNDIANHNLPDLPVWIRFRDHAVALTWMQLRQASLRAQELLREEDAKFYHKLADQAKYTYDVEGLNGIWEHLRAILPKHRGKRMQVPRDIEHELQRHFDQLEAGVVVHGNDLLRTCLERKISAQAKADRQQHLSLSELPTLAEIEYLCLQQKPHKAAGPDGLPSDLCRHGATAIAPQLHAVI